MTQGLYSVTFNNNFATRDNIVAHLDTRRDVIIDWYYCLTNTIFVVSTLNGSQLRDFLKPIASSAEGRFFISEIKKYPANDGWLPQGAWDFINKYSQLG